MTGRADMGRSSNRLISVARCQLGRRRRLASHRNAFQLPSCRWCKPIADVSCNVITGMWPRFEHETGKKNRNVCSGRLLTGTFEVKALGGLSVREVVSVNWTEEAFVERKENKTSRNLQMKHFLLERHENSNVLTSYGDAESAKADRNPFFTRP